MYIPVGARRLPGALGEPCVAPHDGPAAPPHSSGGPPRTGCGSVAAQRPGDHAPPPGSSSPRRPKRRRRRGCVPDRRRRWRRVIRRTPGRRPVPLGARGSAGPVASSACLALPNPEDGDEAAARAAGRETAGSARAAGRTHAGIGLGAPSPSAVVDGSAGAAPLEGRVSAPAATRLRRRRPASRPLARGARRAAGLQSEAATAGAPPASPRRAVSPTRLRLAAAALAGQPPAARRAPRPRPRGAGRGRPLEAAWPYLAYPSTSP